NAWADALTPQRPMEVVRRPKTARYSVCPARFRIGGAWPAMAEPSTVRLKRPRRLDHPGHQRACRDADEASDGYIAWEVVAQVHARQADAGRQTEHQWRGLGGGGGQRGCGGER